MSMDSVDSLVTHPDRLKVVMRECKDDRARMSDVECMHANEAFRRRFMGDGKGKYTTPYGLHRRIDCGDANDIAKAYFGRVHIGLREGA